MIPVYDNRRLHHRSAAWGAWSRGSHSWSELFSYLLELLSDPPSRKSSRGKINSPHTALLQFQLRPGTLADDVTEAHTCSPVKIEFTSWHISAPSWAKSPPIKPVLSWQFTPTPILIVLNTLLTNLLSACCAALSAHNMLTIHADGQPTNYL